MLVARDNYRVGPIVEISGSIGYLASVRSAPSGAPLPPKFHLFMDNFSWFDYDRREDINIFFSWRATFWLDKGIVEKLM